MISNNLSNYSDDNDINDDDNNNKTSNTIIILYHDKITYIFNNILPSYHNIKYWTTYNH